MLTTDKNDPRLQHEPINETTSQSLVHLVLSKEEIAKGFVRPIRKSYIHKGRFYGKDLEVTMLDKPQLSQDGLRTYVALIPIFDKDGIKLGSSYITEEELKQYKETNGYVGGCEALTTMVLEIAETYARNPKFYGATFCCGCSKYINVNEFVWAGTDEKVGS